jgi:2-phosphosulfolactate phosphatase
MVTALANGAEAILPVEEIGEALAVRQRQPHVLLAGERDGVRIGPDLAGGTTFDLGNSPREFTSQLIQNKTIVMTTTNGTRALSACRGAMHTFAASFLNLTASANAVRLTHPAHLLMVCSGTHEQAAYEDVLGAGALCDLLWGLYQAGQVADSAFIARELFVQARNDLPAALSRSRNGRRLLAIPELRDDVAFCSQRDTHHLVARLCQDGLVRPWTKPGT